MHRGDEVATWLKDRRDAYTQFTPWWFAVDDLLEEYRTRCDYGVGLNEDWEEGRVT